MLYNPNDYEDTDPYDPEAISAEIAAHSQIVPVANGTAAAQLVAELASKGWSPTIGDPLLVWRTDLTAAVITTDGTNWQVWAGPQPACVASLTATVPSGGTGTAETPTISRHTGGWVKGLFGSYSLIVPTSGVYAITVALAVSGATPAGRGFAQLVLNDSGSPMARFPMREEGAVAGTVLWDLTAGDGIKVESLQSSGTTRTISGSIRMFGQPTPLWV